MRLCKDCKHFKRKANRLFIGACFNTEFINLGHPIFDGVYSRPVKYERSDAGKCGPEGKYFEERKSETI